MPHLPGFQRVPKPFVKWAGGKGQLLNDIWQHLPITFRSYFEPFVGGGAVFFMLRREGAIKGRAFLSDSNPELVLAYKVIQQKVGNLIEELSMTGKYRNNRDVYYEIRRWEPEDPVERTARFIYLNRTCYNGLYRVNRRGRFNVPFGRYENPQILDANNLRAASAALVDVGIQGPIDFADAIEDAHTKDFVYFDPPYQPLSQTSDFTSYTDTGFSYEEQVRLAKVFEKLCTRGCFVLESNSDTDEIRRLYRKFRISEVFAKRAISCDPKGRGAVRELLIHNYAPLVRQPLLTEFV